jgi:hypothetical protein
MKRESETELPKMRRSACADAALRAEIDRVKKMTALERVNAALNMSKAIGIIPSASFS